MDLFRGAETLMRMDHVAWARHANPWSVYTRFASSLPMFAAIWSVYWIGWWSLLPIGIMVLWTFLNPRLFPAPRTGMNWGTRGVLGERVFLNRKTVPIPREHLVFAYLTICSSGLFMIPAVWGFATGSFWWALTGWLAVVLAKAWFVDRMVWLWEDVKDTHPVYRAWANADWSKTL